MDDVVNMTKFVEEFSIPILSKIEDMTSRMNIHNCFDNIEKGGTTAVEQECEKEVTATKMENIAR